MLRRRGRALLLPVYPAAVFVAAVFLCAIVVVGCGRNDFNNDPRPPVPLEVSVKIANDGVVVSPKEFGAGLANITVANLTNETGSLAIHGPVTADSAEIGPGDADTVKVDMKSGSYEASVDGISVRPYNFTVGPERPSGQNDLLLP
jgi:hypothetical protein